MVRSIRLPSQIHGPPILNPQLPAQSTARSMFPLLFFFLPLFSSLPLPSQSPAYLMLCFPSQDQCPLVQTARRYGRQCPGPAEGKPSARAHSGAGRQLQDNNPLRQPRAPARPHNAVDTRLGALKGSGCQDDTVCMSGQTEIMGLQHCQKNPLGIRTNPLPLPQLLLRTEIQCSFDRWFLVPFQSFATSMIASFLEV